MPIDIVAALKSTASILPSLESILGNLGAKKEVKLTEIDALKSDILIIINKLDNIGSIGSLLDEYIKYHLGSYALYMTSDKLTEQINRYKMQLESGDTDKWETIEYSFRDIKRMKSNYINIMLGRINYLDVRDGTQINIKAQSLNDHFTRAQIYFESKNATELKKCMGLITDASLELYNIFGSSIESMTNSLMHIKGK